MTGMALDFDNGGQEVPIDPALDALPNPVKGEELDPALDPDRFNAISAALLEDEPEDIKIDGPPDGSARLLAGYIDGAGNRWTDVTIRELRGRDEEQLERAFVTGDMTRYIDAILRAGVVQLGPLDESKELAKALDSLLIGDRDVLVLQVRRMAYGDTQRLNVRCPFCEHQFQVDYSYSQDVPMKGFEVDDRSQRLFDLELPGGSVCELRLVDGTAQKLVYTPENMKRTEAELNTLLLAELLVTIDGKPVRGTGPVLDLRMRDRLHILKWLVEQQPGPQYSDVNQECSSCTREFPLVMTLRDMFRGD
jgi:hypothetical protein